MEGIRVNVNLKEYFSKMNPEDSAEITTMCMNKLASKAHELEDLYVQLAKTYSIEMGICDITLLVQVSSPAFPDSSVRCLLGTSEGVKHALATMMKEGIKDIANMEKEENNG